MLAVVVMLGVTACTDYNAEFCGITEEGFYFTADIEHTRADMVKNDGIWQSVWSGDDKLYVTSDKGSFVFANSAGRPNRFVSPDDGAEALRDAAFVVITTQHENGSVVDSDAGKRGLSLRRAYEYFPEDGRVSLEVSSAFLRLSCDSDVTLLADDAIFSGINGSSNLEKSITLKAGDDIWVAFTPVVEKTSLTVMVADKRVLFVDEIVLEPCVIYSLGEIGSNGTTTPTPTPEPEPEEKMVYLVPNEDWKSEGAWFAAYLWEGSDSVNVKLLDEDGDGAYGAVIPENMSNIIFCRMNPAYAEFEWNNNSVTDRMWRQTADLVVGTAPNNYYYITGVDTGEWNRAGYDPNREIGEQSSWAVAGTFNDWTDAPMYTTNVENVFVKPSLALKAGDKFKIKSVGSWSVNFGGGITNLMPNMWMSGAPGGKNIVVSKKGVYDIYFDSVGERIYLMKEGVDYATAIEQAYNGDDPSLDAVSWGLCGTHNNWGSSPDIPLEWDEMMGLYVAYGAEFTEEFKVRANNKWGDDYGSNSRIIVDSEEGEPMTKSGGNCRITPGTYDVYFDLSSALIWVRTPGSAAPTKQ